jgi:integrase
MFLVLSYTGIRVGELVALKWKDIDFINHTISITKTYYNPNNNTLKYQLVPPKTRKSRRKIIVDEDVIIALKEHKKNNIKSSRCYVKLIIITTLSLQRWKDSMDIPSSSRPFKIEWQGF